MDTTIQQAAEVIRQVLYINLATITPDNNPWNTPVFTSYDQELNFYWASWHDNQHSQNIRHNPKVFATIYDSTIGEGQGFGLYMQGTATELDKVSQILPGMTLLYKRMQHKLRGVKEFLTSYPRRIYKFSPQKIWVNRDGDINGNFVDIRKEISLVELRKALKN